MASSGYSGTPLAKKLSLRDGQRVWRLAMPEAIAAEIEQHGVALEWLEDPVPPIDAAHIFVTRRADLEGALRRILPLIDRAGFVWVSWPKKASGVGTDISEDTIREVALPLGLVDIKVCAVDSIWSGLKLMIRRELR